MMRVVERREWLEGVGDDERARREIVFEDSRTGRRHSLTVASEAVFLAHSVGLQVAAASRGRDAAC